ncbi:transcriptional regulator [Arthrobacter sp. Soil782]|uniref:FadR/GntR family transcriptional regulator n=1 Tax=Arthrobacter sp. Soil782 TaxID=1736410 RepID=UPI0006FBFC50|nr:FadR/GntR family transcriptional regulator [Arthrobacter sp. Soil782]KRF05248.1 transcriptional regulator [Arthrobacter sp. Soil782]
MPPAEIESPDVAVFSGLHASVIDQMGLAIGAGEWQSGSIMRIEELEERYGVSRSVIREVLRVLASMGMVQSRRRVGVQVLPATEWNLYDPQVIRWRLASPGRVAQLRSLTELRTAVEPQAARLAAMRAPLADASELMGLAGKLWAAGQDGDTELFLKLDIQFHHLVLSSSGNEMFGKLNSLVAEVLTGRTHYGMMPDHPHEEALQMHVDVASAIQRGHAVDAHAAMLAIMERAMTEMSTLWDEAAHT